jgi:protein TonB
VLLFFSNINAQGIDYNIYSVVDQEAEYIGGYAAMMAFIQKNFYYPQEAIEKNIQGKVTVKFVIEKNGSVSNITMLRGIPECQECDDEALRLVSKMTNWIPAINAGKQVRQWFILPINFSME